jgi:hypothetical protein
MCCFFTTLILLGPRVAAVIWWLLRPTRWVGNTGLSAFSSIIWPILGIIFVPWTTLMFVIIFPVAGFWDWLFLIFAIFADVASYGGGGYGNRERLGM